MRCNLVAWVENTFRNMVDRQYLSADSLERDETLPEDKSCCLVLPINKSAFPTRGGGGRVVFSIMAYTGWLRPKGVPFSGFRYMKG